MALTFFDIDVHFPHTDFYTLIYLPQKIPEKKLIPQKKKHSNNSLVVKVLFLYFSEFKNNSND